MENKLIYFENMIMYEKVTGRYKPHNRLCWQLKWHPQQMHVYGIFIICQRAIWLLDVEFSLILNAI